MKKAFGEKHSTTMRRGYFTRVLFVIALMLAGFTYKPPVEVADNYELAYRLPDGSFAALCQKSNQPGAPQQSHSCPFCTLSHSLAAEHPDCQAYLPRTIAGKIIAFRRYNGPEKTTTIARPRSRAPPLNA